MPEVNDAAGWQAEHDSAMGEADQAAQALDALAAPIIARFAGDPSKLEQFSNAIATAKMSLGQLHEREVGRKYQAAVAAKEAAEAEQERIAATGG